MESHEYSQEGVKCINCGGDTLLPKWAESFRKITRGLCISCWINKQKELPQKPENDIGSRPNKKPN